MTFRPIREHTLSEVYVFADDAVSMQILCGSFFMRPIYTFSFIHSSFMTQLIKDKDHIEWVYIYHFNPNPASVPLTLKPMMSERQERLTLVASTT